MTRQEFNSVMGRIAALWPDADVVGSAAQQAEWFKALSMYPAVQVEEAVSNHYREPQKNLEGKKPALPSLVRIIRAWRQERKVTASKTIGAPSILDQLRAAKPPVTPLDYAHGLIQYARDMCPGDAAYLAGACAAAYRIIRDATGSDSIETRDAFETWQGNSREAGMTWMDWDTHVRIGTDRKFLRERMERRRVEMGVTEPVKRISSDVFVPMKNEHVESEREANDARERLRKEREMSGLLEALP